jgi:thiol-disulfide isomerase/thioredoxin
MQTDLTCPQIERLKSTQATLLLFGGPQCGVCQAIRPKLERLMAQHYPEIAMVYVDCADSPDICAQHGVFSLPVVQLYIEGHVYLERGRSFSLHELGADIERIYRLWKAQA